MRNTEVNRICAFLNGFPLMFLNRVILYLVLSNFKQNCHLSVGFLRVTTSLGQVTIAFLGWP